MDTAAANFERDFLALVDAYQDVLYRFGLRLTANSHDAEDIAQEAFARAYDWLRHNPPPAEPRLRPWLYRVALNVFRNRLRRQPSITAFDPAFEPAGDERAEPACLAERSESRAELAAVLAALPRRYREAVVLRHVEDLTYPEIASVLKRPEGTIKSDVHRGLGLLRLALERTREEVPA